MSDRKKPLEKYYAIMRQPGTGGLGPKDIRLAMVEVDEEPDAGKLDKPYDVLLLFSSFSRAVEYQQRDGRYPSSGGWVCYPLDKEMCRELVMDYKGKATHVVLDPGVVLLTSQPIADFIDAMPYHLFDPDKE